MTEEQQGLKAFMESHFDFDELKKIGFFGSSIARLDYERQAARVCIFFSLDSIFDYMMIGHGSGVLVSTIAATFKCPVCTCEQDLPGSQKIVYKINCAGCKRKLEVSPAGYSNYSITEVDGSKESTITY